MKKTAMIFQFKVQIYEKNISLNGIVLKNINDFIFFKIMFNKSLISMWKT